MKKETVVGLLDSTGIRREEDTVVPINGKVVPLPYLVIRTMPALPIIKVYGAGDGTVTVGDITVQLFGLEDTITLDCEMQNAYRENGGVLENMNLHIYAPEFPNLPPGNCAVSWSGGVKRLEIIPRWWTV